MNPLHANFDELYRRHLCRHSEFGINILHVLSVGGIYFAIFAILFTIPVAGPWLVGAIVVPYWLTIVRNIPLKIFLVDVLAMSVMVAGAWATAQALPWWMFWIHVLAIKFWHWFQNWNHKVYTVERDMSEFAEKYKKGFALFCLLSIYELPILINYLVFDRQSWTQPEAESSVQQ